MDTNIEKLKLETKSKIFVSKNYGFENFLFFYVI